MSLSDLARPGPPASFNPSNQSRKPILHKKGPARSRGHEVSLWDIGPSWATRELQPLRSVTQADFAQDWPQREAGARSQDNDQGVHISHAARADSHYSG